MVGASRGAAGSLVLAVVLLAGCGSTKGGTATPPAVSKDATGGSKREAPPTVQSNADGTIPSGTGTEREKPAAGKGNVQGKVFYNGKPVPGVEVRLCETFNRFLGGGGGQTFTTRTDQQGEYLIKNVPPRTYEGLLVRVFDSNSFVFATSGFIGAAKYRIEADRTYFAPDTNLFKNDLKLETPKAGAKVAAEGIEVKWKPYPDAAYYKLSINADSQSGAKTEYEYINKRVDGLTYMLDKPLTPGLYRCEVEAYNSSDVKLAESPDDIKFTVKR